MRGRNKMLLNERLKLYADMTESGLERYLPREDCFFGRIFDACRYSLLDGGKRLRPALLMEFYRICGGKDMEAALQFACGLEMIHSYSLIHDDLPCMDDDDMRRGRPSNHKAFDEATAVLAGDGLLNRAFEVFMAPSPIPAERVLSAVRYIAHASGIYGMIGGQMSDLLMEDRPTTGEMLREMVALKTGAIIKAACAAGCILAGAGEDKLAAAERYAEYIGEAFQIRDDILDVIGDSEVFGKATGSDGRNEKTTFVSAFGIEVAELTALAVREAAAFEDAEFLTELAQWLAEREH